MAKFEITTIINKPPDVVWKAFIDQENMTHWMRYLEKVEVIKGKFGEVGAMAHLHYVEKGRSYVLEDKMLSYEEGKRIKSLVSGQGMIIEVETNIESISDGTKISMMWNGTSKSFIARIILKLMRGKISRQAQAEIDTFKRLVETYGIHFLNND
jgi:uncharacterized membrane protein